MHKRIFKSIGIVAVVAATAVPSALATHVIEIGGLTPLGGVSIKAAPKAVDQSDVFTRYVANHTAAGYDGYKSSYPQLHAVGQSGTTVPYLSHGIGVDASQFGGTGVAQTAGHDPDLLVKPTRVTVYLSTHDVGGISAKDFEVAGLIDQG